MSTSVTLKASGDATAASAHTRAEGSRSDVGSESCDSAPTKYCGGVEGGVYRHVTLASRDGFLDDTRELSYGFGRFLVLPLTSFEARFLRLDGAP
jgi:hypothetical protein